MLRFIAIYLSIFSFKMLLIFPSIDSKTDCEKSAPHKFTLAEKESLCLNNTTVFPGKCAKAARRLKGFISPEQTINLCQNASSTSPVQCVNTLPSKLETSIKIFLCATADSITAALCYNQIKNSKLKLSDFQKASICRSEQPPTVSSAECANRLTRTFGADEALKLCAGAQSSGPAICATSLTAGKISAEIIAELCENAKSKAPAECFKRAPANYHQIQKMQLCKEAESEAPANCVRAIRSTHISTQQKIDVCQKTNSTGPAECLSALNTLSISVPEKVLLCRGATSDTPAKCLKQVRTSLKPMDLAIQLCMGAESLAVASCLKEAPFGLDPEQKFALCAGAKSNAPASCIKKVQGKFMPASKHLAVELCQKAESEGPQDCFSRASQAYRERLSEEQKVRLCYKASSEGPAVCAENAPTSRRFPGDTKVELCRAAQDAGPMLCAAAAPSSLADEQVVALCKGAQGEVTSLCARSAPFFLSVHETAALCTGAASVIPAICADTVGSLLSSAQTVELCQGAQTLTPAFCALHLRHYALDHLQMNMCRTTVSLPSQLIVTALGFEGKVLLPNSPFYVHLRLLDQFSQPMIWENSTWVSTSIPVKGSNGARIGGQTVNKTSAGQVQFNDLSFDIDGDFTVRFSVNDAVLTSFRVVVGSDWEYRICDTVYDLFQCLPEEHDANGTNAIKTEMISSAQTRRMLGCLDSVAESGFDWTTGWQGGIWIFYPSGLDALESGYGIPTSTMDYFERLGVEEGSVSSADIKRAYYKQSLLWHPDRWAKFPQYAERVNEVFQLIGEAYHMLKSTYS
mmetsp:Transcript_8734/g.11339  ORF Transcript_8734/g.11339 Transcript_8734/m.11339 type:complete len:803 (-) Transcript_8734:175-2583(-)